MGLRVCGGGGSRLALGALGLSVLFTTLAGQSRGLQSSTVDFQQAPPPDSLSLAARGGSLEAQLEELLRLWLEAQNRRDLGLLTSLYMPCFDDATAPLTG